MEISKEDLESIKNAGISIFLNEIKSFYLLGNTNEYDSFEPTNIDLTKCSDFDKYKCACCLYAGFKINEDEDLAYTLWREGAQAGHKESMLEYSVCLFNDEKVEEGFQMLQSAANAGNKIAQFRITLCYMFGYGTNQNEKKAFVIFEKLAEEDFPNAVYMMGSFYMTDTEEFFVKRDTVKGWELIKKACKLGSPFAQYGCGRCQSFRKKCRNGIEKRRYDHK